MRSREAPRVVALILTCACLGAIPGQAQATPCANEEFRTGPSAQLPDCRAYEMVTPADSNGRLFETGISPWANSDEQFAVEPVNPSGDSLVFQTIGGGFSSPPGGNGQVAGDVWQAVRGSDGWQIARHVTPTGDEAVYPNPGGISKDHSYTFVYVQREELGLTGNGSLAAAGEAAYLGDPGGNFELTGIGSLGVERLVQGRYISPEGKHVIFSSGRSPTASGWCSRYETLSTKTTCPVAQLEPNAPPAGTGAIYDREATGPTHVVSLLPGNVTPAAGQEAFYQGASADGTSVAFKIGPATESSLSYPLFIRIHGDPAGETKLVSNEASIFGGISADGRYLYYLSGASLAGFSGDIHRYDSETEEDVKVNTSDDAKMVNVSADGTHLYFISPSQLDGGKGTAGKPNLYVWSGGVPKFVATVEEADTDSTHGLTTWASSVVLPKRTTRSGPGANTSRTTPDGKVIAFESQAQLTDYDNDGHTEIYRYDVEAKTIVCVSCSPVQEPAVANAKFQDGQTEVSTLIHNLSDDGSKVFFESPEALVTGDQDAVIDIYEWHSTPGGGELALISSGDATEYANFGQGLLVPAPNLLMGASSDGADVFFSTLAPLLPGAPVGGVSMIYDARINGGFPEPLPPSTPCLEEGCRPPLSQTPTFSGAGSANFQGPGNPRRAKKKNKKRRACRHRRRDTGPRPCPKRRPRQLGDLSARSTAPRTDGSSSESVAASPPTTAGATSSPSPDPPAVQANGSSTGTWGIESVGAELSTTQAARHADFTASLSLGPPSPQEFAYLADPTAKDYLVTLPPGLYGNPNVVPRCRTGDFLGAECPIDSQVGVSQIRLFRRGAYGTFPIYNLTPVHPDREIARFGLLLIRFPTFIDVSVDTAGDYKITAGVHDINSVERLEGAKTTFWADPADPVHDKERMKIQEGYNCQRPCNAPGEERSTEELEPVAFMTNPSACQEGEVGTTITAYQFPGQVFGASAPLPPIEGCEGLPFAPSFEARPTTDVAGAPTGLKTKLSIPQHKGCAPIPGSEQRLEELHAQRQVVEEKRQQLHQLEEDKASAAEIQAAKEALGQAKAQQGELNAEPFYECEAAAATMREARVTLPEGMAINPGAADGLDACSDARVHFHQELDAACPDGSKLGTAEISSPALPHPLQGAIYQRSPQGKGNLFGLWLVADDLGLHIKIPGRIEPDPNTGQITAIFADLPQVPVSEIDLDFWGGARAPLKNPEACGTYETTTSFKPHSDDPPVLGSDSFAIERGPGGGPCFSDPAAAPNAPELEAGTEAPIAATYTPFFLKLRREDGSQPFASLQLRMPPGLTGKLAGIPPCPDAALAAAASNSAAAELASPSCPAASRIGSVWTAAGAGPAPLWTKGEVYLAGPYQGAPLSAAIITPAQAGPFDLGAVLVRSALDLEPQSAAIEVTANDIPRIIEGVPLNIRTVAVRLERPEFTRTGTSCDPLAFSGSLTSAFGQAAPLTERYQLGECSRLKFKPKLSLALEGSTKRTSNPALVADLRARPADANIGRAQVKLPRAAFLDNAHIGTVCTRVQYAADACPKRSVLGSAWATTPLLDYKLKGTVYLRSSSNPLPDLVVKLKGPDSQPLQFDLIGRTDAVKGALRNTFEAVPDAPVSRFHLQLFGGRRGIIQLSSGLCRRPRATVKLTAQNGKAYDTRPVVETGCGKGGGKGARRGAGGGPGR